LRLPIPLFAFVDPNRCPGPGPRAWGWVFFFGCNLATGRPFLGVALRLPRLGRAPGGTLRNAKVRPDVRPPRAQRPGRPFLVPESTPSPHEAPRRMLVKVGAAAGQAAPRPAPRPRGGGIVHAGSLRASATQWNGTERYLAQERPLRALGHEPLRGPRLLQRGDREAGRPRGPEVPRERAPTRPRGGW
jgi:hypothetical protein